MTNIETFIKQHIPQYKNSLIDLPFETMQTKFQKNQIVTSYGQIENKVMLLCEGVIQVSVLKEDEERILEFVFPGEFFCAYTSFLLQESSDVQVVALTKCVVIAVKSEDLLQANIKSLVSSHLSLCIAQQLFLSRARREKDFLILSAEERYRMLLEKDPEVIKLIPGNKIAKYLGIQAESLSRIRRSIIT
jgi:CRP-like cAMP-binding protein